MNITSEADRRQTVFSKNRVLNVQKYNDIKYFVEFKFNMPIRHITL